MSASIKWQKCEPQQQQNWIAATLESGPQQNNAQKHMEAHSKYGFQLLSDAHIIDLIFKVPLYFSQYS